MIAILTTIMMMMTMIIMITTMMMATTTMTTTMMIITITATATMTTASTTTAMMMMTTTTTTTTMITIIIIILIIIMTMMILMMMMINNLIHLEHFDAKGILTRLHTATKHKTPTEQKQNFMNNFFLYLTDPFLFRGVGQMFLQSLVPLVHAAHSFPLALVSLADEAGFRGCVNRQSSRQRNHTQRRVRVGDALGFRFVSVNIETMYCLCVLFVNTGMLWFFVFFKIVFVHTGRMRCLYVLLLL